MSHSGSDNSTSNTSKTSVSTLFHRLPAKLPPSRRSSCGYACSDTCLTIAGIANTPMISTAVTSTTGRNKSTSRIQARCVATSVSGHTLIAQAITSDCWNCSCSQAAACDQNANANPSHSSSAIATGHSISSSMRGCSRLANARIKALPISLTIDLFAMHDNANPIMSFRGQRPRNLLLHVETADSSFHSE